MKAKTIVGLMACAVLAPAFADTINNNNPTVEDWFSSGVASETISTSNASWGQSAPSLNTAKTAIEIDADVASPATLTPNSDAVTTASKKSDGLVTITSKAYLAPSAKADLPGASALGNAQVGFAVATETINDVATTSFYAYTKTSDGGVWTRLSASGVSPSAEVEDTDFTIVLDYRTSKVTFSVGATPVTLAAAEETVAGAIGATELAFVPVAAKLSDVAAIGSGTITSIDAKFENAVAVGKDGKAYGTIAEAYNTDGPGTVVAWDSTTGAAATGDDVYALNGLTKAVCMALNMPTDVATAKIALRPADATKKVANKITLATAVDPVQNVTVAFDVQDDGSDATFPADAIQIPLATGTYTVTPVVTAGVTAGND